MVVFVCVYHGGDEVGARGVERVGRKDEECAECRVLCIEANRCQILSPHIWCVCWCVCVCVFVLSNIYVMIDRY